MRQDEVPAEPCLGQVCLKFTVKNEPSNISWSASVTFEGINVDRLLCQICKQMKVIWSVRLM